MQFDGRPITLLDGRRYVTSKTHADANFSTRLSRWWLARWPLIRDQVVERDNPLLFSPRYPHRGQLDPRPPVLSPRAFEELLGPDS